ncbi:NUDIX hydrolase [Camelliibacillus cellulosilyticus]|uniref:NUDIX hydrolase n=1 Tax=Camelliibacillus cellulosilyticus TaxID=2174486 RepID=A0ABV9GMQ7_9BACL
MELLQINHCLGHHNASSLIGEKDAVKAAVLIPLIEGHDGVEILFEVRSHQLKRQPGDICFPGGKLEIQDPSLCETAIRETSEELGLNKNSIKIVGPLGIYAASSQLVVYPFVGRLTHTTFQLNADEVDHVFTIPLDWLLQTEPEKHLVTLKPLLPIDFPFEKIARGKKYQWRERQHVEYFYNYGQKSVWGMTARILKYFLELLKQQQP